MACHLKIGLWNANGLTQHAQELKIFLDNKDIDIMLISESHYTNRSHLKIHNYSVYNTQHPDGTAHGGTAVIIKSKIKHHEGTKYNKDYIQATSIVVEDWVGPINITAVYCPPKHSIALGQFEDFFNILGHRFLAGGDYNAKHPYWGSRLRIPNPKGRQLYETMQRNNLQHLSTGEPTYWPTDRGKTPDCIDFCITKGIASSYLTIESCFELSSDHSPLLVTLSSAIKLNNELPYLNNRRTNWEHFRDILNKVIDCNISLKTEVELEEAIENFTKAIQKAAWESTPVIKTQNNIQFCSLNVKAKIKEKRKIRKQWQLTRSTKIKTKLNKVTKELKILLQNEKNLAIQKYLENLTATETTDYSLWKATKKIKQPQKSIPPIRLPTGNWARSDAEKAEAFAVHLTEVFQPFDSEVDAHEEEEIHQLLESPLQMCGSKVKFFKIKEIKDTIKNHLNPKKTPGFDLINGKVLRELPEKAFREITIFFNAILRLNYIPNIWKVAQVILILKPGKDPLDVSSYRPISLLPMLSKVFEKLILKRLRPILLEANLLPKHQFGFREQHSTIEQVHRTVRTINDCLENKEFCSAAFLDVTQAFDKVWHAGLLYKIKQYLPHCYFDLLRSYLNDRHFLVKYNDAFTKLYPIKAGVPQGSVLGPTLYLLFTSDLPSTNNSITATFADDTAILTSHSNATVASERLQDSLTKIQPWLKKWRIRINESKSTHITFTTRRDTCPPVTLNNQVLPQKENIKYLGIHLDQRLTWRKHIWMKRKQLGLKLQKMYWLLGHKSKLTLENKILLYKSILKPVWTYGIQLWGTASNSNIEILQRFQSKVLRTIVNAPWFVPNEMIQKDLKIASVKEEIRIYSEKYCKRLSTHPNDLAVNLLNEKNDKRRLKRFKPIDLTTRFS